MHVFTLTAKTASVGDFTRSANSRAASAFESALRNLQLATNGLSDKCAFSLNSFHTVAHVPRKPETMRSGEENESEKAR
jgi:hypothetical protein